LTELQAGWSQPGRLVLGHPFNPPHLIPLVEVMGNEHTDAGVVGAARAFYESVGKVTIEVKREVPGHVANRLQATLAAAGADTIAWYGVRLFTDHCDAEDPPADFDALLDAEEQAGRRDPYRAVAALTHTIARVR
jgi:hypothetical protein